MGVTAFTKPKGVLTIVTALVFIIDPNLVFQFFAMHLDDAGVMMSRILGGAYLGSGVGIWLINGPEDISTLSAYLYAIGEFISAAAIFVAMLNHVMNPLGWLLVGAYLLFVGGFLFVAAQTKKT